MEYGFKNRAIGIHNLNEHSSRSHLIYTIHVSATYLAIDNSN